MADAVKQPLLHPLPASASSPTLPLVPPAETGSLPGGVDVLTCIKKERFDPTCSWIRIEAATALPQKLNVDKATVMGRYDLPARDLRLLNPLFVYPPTILGREHAILINLEKIRCVITADEVLLHNSSDIYIMRYVVELQRRRLTTVGVKLPFEFEALQGAIESACTFLDSETVDLENEAYLWMDNLTKKISTLNLGRVRHVKSILIDLIRRIQKLRDEIERLMNDDEEMAEMYLTEKNMRMESSDFGDQSLLAFNSAGAATSVSAPVSPVSSPTESRNLEKTFSICSSGNDSVKSSDNTVTEHIEEGSDNTVTERVDLEMLLETWFLTIDSILNKQFSLLQHIDETEEYINVELHVSFSSHCAEIDDDQARELKVLEDILSDPSAEPIKQSFGFLNLITNKFSNEIGRGGFGVVCKGDLRNEVVAVKMSNAYNVSNKQFMDEIKCLKSAKHKNIVRFLGYCADTQEEMMPLDGTFVMAGKRNRLLCFEYVPNGDIRQYLQQEKTQGYDWPTRYHMIRGICEGLWYLHDKNISHLDLKPENVMLDAHMEAKITDFGLSRFLDQGQSRMITQHILGTRRYIAPEIIDKGEISLKSDIYALGIIIIELLTGINMISLGNWHELVDMGNPQVRSCIEAIARKCIEPDKDKRPTVGEIIHELDETESMVPELTNNKGSSARKVAGRSSLNNKLLLLHDLETKDDVVAVTGDCTNHAPTSHQDVGIESRFHLWICSPSHF